VQGRTAIEQATLDGSTEIVGPLLAAGAKRPVLDAVDEFAACCMRADRPAVERLLRADATLPEQAVGRRPELIVRAAGLDHLDAVRCLVENGFDVNHLERRAPLHEAAFNGSLAMVELLLELGADPDTRDADHESTPLGWARYSGRQEVAARLARASG
jgi:ankyrin repeat protein